MRINPSKESFIKINLEEFKEFERTHRPINLDVCGKRRFGYLDIKTGNFAYEYGNRWGKIFVKIKHIFNI